MQSSDIVLYLVNKMTFNILTTFIGRKYTTVLGTYILTKLVGMVYFDKSCFWPLQSQSSIYFFKAFLNLGTGFCQDQFTFFGNVFLYFLFRSWKWVLTVTIQCWMFFLFPNKCRKLPFLKRLHHFSKVFLKKWRIWYLLFILEFRTIKLK